MWNKEKGYYDLMRELWGSPQRWNARRTYADVAAKLGVDEETVRNRLKRMKDSGFLVGWRVVPNPANFGRESAMMLLRFEDQERKETGVANLKRADGVITLASAYGTELIVTYFDDPGHKDSKRIAKTRGVAEAQSIGGMLMPSTDFTMTPTDWEIVQLTIRDAELNLRLVAKKAKVSPRTVKRRLNNMIDSSAISVMPIIDQSKSGGVQYTMMIESAVGRTDEIVEMVAPKIRNLVFSAAYSNDGLIFGFTAQNVAEGAEALRRVRNLGGIKLVRLLMIDEVIYVFDWLEREAEARTAGGVRTAKKDRTSGRARP